MTLLDFYDFVALAESYPACEDMLKDALLKHFGGRHTLDLQIDSRPVIIAPQAFWKSESGPDSLEHTILLARKLNCEIPFMCLIDEKHLIVCASFRGTTGIFGDCWWTKGDLRARSFAAARSRGLRVMLGHTHPASYGAVCSNIRRVKSHVYGEDYWLMRGWMRRKRGLISRFHIIMTPRANQIGIFELRPRGVVVYHPWKIGIR